MWCDNEYLSTRAAGGPTLWPIGPLYDVAPPFLQALHYSFPISTTHSHPLSLSLAMLSFGFHVPALSQDMCTCPSSARTPVPDSSHVTSFSWSSQLKCHFFRDPLAIHWPAALDFLHFSIFISSFVAHVKCIIIYPPLDCELHAETTPQFIHVHTTPSIVECRKSSVKYVFSRWNSGKVIAVWVESQQFTRKTWRTHQWLSVII